MGFLALLFQVKELRNLSQQPQGTRGSRRASTVDPKPSSMTPARCSLVPDGC